jgi:ribose transport system permease protein
MIKLLKLYEQFGIFLFILAGSVILMLATPTFLTRDTILNIVTQGTYGAIVGFGMTFAITSGGFDLSVETPMAMCSVVLALLIPLIGVISAIPAAIAFASLIGIFNGVIIAKLRVSPLITTIATLSIMRGMSLIVAGGRQIVITERWFAIVGTGRSLGIPNPVWIMLGLFIIFYVVLYHTPFGRHVSAVGSNEYSARISGINVDRVKILVYWIVALTAAVAGMIRTSQTLIGIPTMSPDFMLTALTVTILGGTSLSGGRGNLWGTLFAGIFIAMIYYGLNLMDVAFFFQRLALGGVLILALFIDGVRKRYLEAAKARGVIV